MKPHSTKVFRDIVNALGSFIQSLFIVPNTGNSTAVGAPAGQFTDRSDKILYLVYKKLKKTILVTFPFLNYATPSVVFCFPSSIITLRLLFSFSRWLRFGVPGHRTGWPGGRRGWWQPDHPGCV